jgi:hypothetical protein
MRLCEAILIVLAGQLSLAIAVIGGRGPKWTNLLPLILLAPLAAHLATETARWLMAPAYLAVVCLCLVGAVRYLRASLEGGRTGSGRSGTVARVAPHVMGVMSFLLLMGSAAAVVFSP